MIMFDNKIKFLVLIFVVIPLLITFMASSMIVQNEKTRVLMYVKWQPPEKSQGQIQSQPE